MLIGLRELESTKENEGEHVSAFNLDSTYILGEPILFLELQNKMHVGLSYRKNAPKLNCSLVAKYGYGHVNW